MALGDRIKKKRDERGMTLKELADKVGVTEATMSRYETNTIKNPTNERLKDIATALNVDINYLMDWDNSDEKRVKDRYVASDEEEMDLIRICRKLTRRERIELLGKAYELERIHLRQENR